MVCDLISPVLIVHIFTRVNFDVGIRCDGVGQPERALISAFARKGGGHFPCLFGIAVFYGIVGSLRKRCILVGYQRGAALEYAAVFIYDFLREGNTVFPVCAGGSVFKLSVAHKLQGYFFAATVTGSFTGAAGRDHDISAFRSGGVNFIIIMRRFHDLSAYFYLGNLNSRFIQSHSMVFVLFLVKLHGCGTEIPFFILKHNKLHEERAFKISRSVYGVRVGFSRLVEIPIFIVGR